MGLFDKLLGRQPTVEWSANFDTETLETLIQRVSAKWPQVVTTQHIQDFMTFVRSLHPDDEKPFSFTASHNGVDVPITFRVFMDDVDAPDVYFIAFPELIQSVKAEHKKLCEELGI